MSDFYVGYLPKAPPSLGRFVQRIILLLAVIVLTVAAALIAGQKPFANSFFEYGNVRPFEGRIEAHPYPTLVVPRPGDVSNEVGTSRYLLVAPGKHGADDIVASLDGKQVRLQGQMIYRDGGVMVEVEPGSIGSTNVVPSPPDRTTDLGAVTVRGEIVDSKCYLGVMNPGQGKVHRDCAARCLSGGIPPILVTLDRGDQYLLIGLDRRPLTRNVLREFAAEVITIDGELLTEGNRRLLMIDPAMLHHSR